MALSKKIFKVLATIVAILLLVVVIALAGAKIFVSLRGEWVAAQVQEVLRSQTDMPWEINGKVGIVFWPAPGAFAENVVLPSVHHQESPPFKLFQAERLDVQIDLKSLFFGRIWPAEVEVISPQFIMSYSKGGKPAWVVSDIGSEDDQPKELVGPEVPLEIMPLVDKLMGQIFAQPLPLVKITDGRFAYFSVYGKLYQDISNINLSLRTEGQSGAIDFSLLYTAQQANFTCTLDGHLLLGGEKHILKGQVRAGLEIHQEEDALGTRGQMQTSLLWEKGASKILLPDVRIAAEGDSLEADLAFDWEGLVLTGTGRVVKASLPRWFLFARILTPELQEVLDNISGTCNLYIDKKGLLVNDILVDVGPLQGTGFVRVDDFFKPVVEVTVNLPHVDVDSIFPFLAPPNATVPLGVAPEFSHRYLVPFGVSYDKPHVGPPTVGYEVNIAASSISVHGADAGATQVRIFPSTNGDARVSFSGNGIFEGRVTGQLDFSDSQVLMRYTVDGLRLLPMPENLDNDIIVDARLSGQCRITVPVIKGEWANRWHMEPSIHLTDFKLLGGQVSGNKWYVSTKGMEIGGRGELLVDQAAGVAINTAFRVYYHGAASSWNPAGTDELTTNFEGRFVWPPIDPVDADTRKRHGVELIEGHIVCDGLYTLPVGNIIIPIMGKASSDLRWETSKNLLRMQNSSLKTSGSTATGDTTVDFSGPSPTVVAKHTIDIDLPKLLADWDMVPHVGVNLPKHVSGELEMFADPNLLLFSPLRIFVDGMTIKGDVRCDFAPEVLASWSGVPRMAFGGHDGVDNTSTILGDTMVEGLGIESPQQPGNTLRRAYFTKLRDERYEYWRSRREVAGEAAGQGRRRTAIQILESTKALWTIRLYGSSVVLDSYIASNGTEQAAQEKSLPDSDGFDLEDMEVPLDLTVLKGLSLDAKVNFGQVSVKNLNFNNVYIDARIDDSRFVLRTRSKDFYGGELDQRLQGAATAPDRLRVDVLALEATNFNAGQVLNAVTGQTAYGGTANLGFNISGTMHTRSDFPREFSGVWHFSAERGTYPAIIGARSSGQSHSFREASGSGAMDAGVLRWRNFRMDGPVINMRSRGSLDLVGRTVDANVTVTVARIPTIPVRISGSLDSPSIDIRQTRMLIQTVGAAGSTLFSIVRGVFDLPANVLSTFSRDRSDRRESFRDEEPLLLAP